MFFDTDELYRGSDGEYIKFTGRNKAKLPKLNHTYVFKDDEEVDSAIAEFIETIISAYEYLGYHYLNPYHRMSNNIHYASLIIYDDDEANIFTFLGNYERYTVIAKMETFSKGSDE